MNTVDIPKLLAIAQACCPPAPPKQAIACRAVSYPLAWVRALIGLHIASLATLTKPIATSLIVFLVFKNEMIDSYTHKHVVLKPANYNTANYRTNTKCSLSLTSGIIVLQKEILAIEASQDINLKKSIRRKI